MEVLVLFDYDAQADDELTIRKGDIITNVVKQEGGWWEGTLAGKRGAFPDNFVKVTDEGEMSVTKKTSPVVHRSVKGRQCKVLFSYTPVHEDELELMVGEELQFLGEVEEGWWRGAVRGKVGVFPSNFVSLLEEAPDPAVSTPAATSMPVNGVNNNSTSSLTSSNNNSDAGAPQLPPKPVRETAKVLYPYTAQQPDELDLKEGDVIYVISRDCEDKGWWKGESHGKIGVFPDNFVELLPLPNAKPTSKPERPPVPPGVPATAALRGVTTSSSETDGISASSEASSPLANLASVAASVAKKAQQQQQPMISLSDEQKLEQVTGQRNAEELDLDIVAANNQALSHPTASRARPNKRRPPSAAFIKEFENSGPLSSPTSNGTLSVPQEVQEQAETSEVKTEEPQVVAKEKQQPVKPPWMEELKRSQEKRNNSAAAPVPAPAEKPVVPAAKPSSFVKPAKPPTPATPAAPSPFVAPVAKPTPKVSETSPVGAKGAKVAAAAAVVHKTPADVDVQHELLSLRSQVRNLEDMVVSLKTELSQLKKVVEEERRLRIQKEVTASVEV